jgi:hypothetical protein
VRFFIGNNVAPHVHWMDGTTPVINTFATPVLAVLDVQKLD